MKTLLYIGLGIWFLGWLYAWIVVWGRIDIWRWIKREKPDLNQTTTIVLTDEYIKAHKIIKKGAIIDFCNSHGKEIYIVISRKGNVLTAKKYNRSQYEPR